VVSSDALIQLSVLHAGVLRVSAREFRAELEWTLGQIEQLVRRTNDGAHTSRIDANKLGQGGRENGK